MKVQNTLYMMSHVSPRFIRDLEIFNIVYLVVVIALIIKNIWFKSTDLEHLITIHDQSGKIIESVKHEFENLKHSMEQNRHSLQEMQKKFEHHKVMLLKLSKDLGKH